MSHVGTWQPVKFWLYTCHIFYTCYTQQNGMYMCHILTRFIVYQFWQCKYPCWHFSYCSKFKFPTAFVDNCHTVPNSIADVPTLIRVVPHHFRWYSCDILSRVILCIYRLFTCSHWNLSWCASFYCTRVRVDTCRIVQIFVADVSTFPFQLLYTCLHGKVSYCTNICFQTCARCHVRFYTKRFVHVPRLPCVVLYKILV